MAYAIIGIAKLKGAAVGSSDSHADRRRETLNADEELLDKNIYLRGGKTPLRELLNKNFKEFGGKQRSDAVECLEFMCSASQEYFFSEEGKTKERIEEFVEKIEEFIEVLDRLGIKVVKAVIHLDETTPHASLFGPPRDENGFLNAKYHIGTRAKMAGFHDEYARIMKPLGLKRGLRGSHATHQDVKKFYNTIINEAEVEIAPTTIPAPPAFIKNQAHLDEYKQQVALAVKAELVPQITHIRDQAMLAKHYKGFKEAAEERAAKLENDLKNKEVELENTKAEIKKSDDKLEEIQARLQEVQDIENDFAETKKQLAAFQTKQTDLPLIKVSQIFTGQAGTVAATGETYFSDGTGELSFYIENDTAYTVSGEEHAETSIELSQKILKNQGKAGTLPEVISRLAEHFNDEEITSAIGCHAYRKAQANSQKSAVENTEAEILKTAAETLPLNEANKISVDAQPKAFSQNEILRADDAELFEALDRILPTDAVKVVPFHSGGVRADEDNNKKAPVNQSIIEENLPYKEVDENEEVKEINFNREEEINSVTKPLEEPAKKLDEFVKKDGITADKSLTTATNAPKPVDVEREKAVIESVLPEKTGIKPVVPNVSALQKPEALRETKTSDSFSTIGGSLETGEDSRIPEQIAAAPVTSATSEIQKAPKTISDSAAPTQKPTANNISEPAVHNSVAFPERTIDVEAEPSLTHPNKSVNASEIESDSIKESVIKNTSDKEHPVDRLNVVSGPAVQSTKDSIGKPVSDIPENTNSDGIDAVRLNISKPYRSSRITVLDAANETDTKIQEATGVLSTADSMPRVTSAKAESQISTKNKTAIEVKAPEKTLPGMQKEAVSEIHIQNARDVKSAVTNREIAFNEQELTAKEETVKTINAVKPANPKIEVKAENQPVQQERSETVKLPVDTQQTEEIKNVASSAVLASQRVESESESIISNLDAEEISYANQLSSNRPDTYSSDDFFYREQERILHENIAEQSRELQAVLEQNTKQLQVQQENFQQTIDNITQKFNQLEELSRQTYEEPNVQEDGTFENLQRLTSDPSQETQNQPILSDEEIQTRLAKATGMDLSANTPTVAEELSASQPSQQQQQEQASSLQQKATREEEEELSEDEELEEEAEFEREFTFGL
jgi:hypothetical protein